MTRRYNDQIERAYGRQPPHSAARDLRNENANLGLWTCHCCNGAFDPQDVIARFYCSEVCARGDDRKYARSHPAITIRGDEITIDNRDCRCAK